ncbi:hypothetical protein [Rhizobium grahamii]|uniref:Uncharacterized protein n=1 Tax=Rhizobium grahamii TaxID=1120045 RepID=A0A370KF52_9HYPH|nr:hypothetical protein [Rhizobium grahamii]RDJ02949.1 hypothetical protein B5K06_31115 [Rhizobium grahamii]
MAKKYKIPKKVAGYKVPKAIRKSQIVSGLLASDIGRGILANALTAAAGAAAAVLIGEKDEIADTAAKGATKGKRALGIAGSAISMATEAAIDVVKSSARDSLPKKIRREMKDRPRQGAVH